MSGLYMGAVIAVAVIAMIVAISKFKQHPFLVMIVISILVGLACGMPMADVIKTVKDGFGGILASIGIVIVATLIGVLFFKEKLRPLQITGLVVAIAAIALAF